MLGKIFINFNNLKKRGYHRYVTRYKEYVLIGTVSTLLNGFDHDIDIHTM